MKTIMLAAALCLFSAPVWADGATCKSTAADKHLAGAANTSFMKKCESDAQKTCDATATEKKLFGAARTSFTKKCVADAVGS